MGNSVEDRLDAIEEKADREVAGEKNLLKIREQINHHQAKIEFFQARTKLREDELKTCTDQARKKKLGKKLGLYREKSGHHTVKLTYFENEEKITEAMLKEMETITEKQQEQD